MAFGLTPAGAGFPPQAPDAFPNYIQFQSDGTDLGGANADTVNFRRNLTATRGTGENANIITVDADAFGWTEVTTDHLIANTDIGNGLKVNSAEESVIVTVPGDTQLGIEDAGDGTINGVSMLIEQHGAAVVSVVGQSGVTINVRTGLLAETAGQYAVLSLIRNGANSWVLCGDLATA